MPKSQTSETSALELLKAFIDKNNIELTVAPLKFSVDQFGRFVIDKPQVIVSFKEKE